MFLSLQSEPTNCVQSLVLRICPHPLDWGVRSVWTLPVSAVRHQAYVPSKEWTCQVCHLQGKSIMKLVSPSWLFCWPPGTWRTWGSGGSSLSPLGRRFWIGPVQNRTVWGASGSLLWWLWSCGQDLPVEKEKSYYHEDRISQGILNCQVLWYSPHVVHQSRWTHRKFSWLWWPVLKVSFPCSPHKPSRRQCSPHWTPRPGTLWTGTVHLENRRRELTPQNMWNDQNIFIRWDSEDLLWLDNSLSNDSLHVKGSLSHSLQRNRSTLLGKSS